MNELKTLTRRDCLVAASALAVVGGQAFARGATAPPITVTADPAQPSIPASVRVVGDGYVWSWTAIETEVSVVAASRTNEPLTRASSVAIVPLGDGEVQLSRTGRLRRAELVHHYADGSSHSESIVVKDRSCKLRLKTRGPGGVPLEWCELRFA